MSRTAEYDRHFRTYASIFFDGLVAWPWFLAQAIVESALDPNAVSPAGARGLMQIMPATAADIARGLQVVPDIFDPRCNIMFGINYMRRQWDIFRRESGLERLRFAMGAYNAGAGHIIRAQGLAERPDHWGDVSSTLHAVTGDDNARQTSEYVAGIEATRLRLIAE